MSLRTGFEFFSSCNVGQSEGDERSIHDRQVYASLRAPSLMTTGISTGSWPYFSANDAFAFAMNVS